MEKKISLITVTFRDDDLLRVTLDNVKEIKASYNIEYIVIDGDINNKSWHREYADIIDILIVEEDKGIYDAMNKGLKVANGDLIGIINSGDTYEIGSFSLVQNFDGDVLTGNLLKCFGKKSIVIRKTPSDLNYVSRFMPINHPATFVRLRIYREFGFFDSSYKLAADNKFFWTLIVNGVNIEFTDRVLARMAAGGRSERFSTLVIRVREHYRIRNDMGLDVLSNIILTVHGFMYSLRSLLVGMLR